MARPPADEPSDDVDDLTSAEVDEVGRATDDDVNDDLESLTSEVVEALDDGHESSEESPAEPRARAERRA